MVKKEIGITSEWFWRFLQPSVSQIEEARMPGFSGGDKIQAAKFGCEASWRRKGGIGHPGRWLRTTRVTKNRRRGHKDYPFSLAHHSEVFLELAAAGL